MRLFVAVFDRLRDIRFSLSRDALAPCAFSASACPLPGTLTEHGPADPVEALPDQLRSAGGL